MKGNQEQTKIYTYECRYTTCMYMFVKNTSKNWKKETRTKTKVNSCACRNSIIEVLTVKY